MATKRRRGRGWSYCVRRKGVLPRPIYLTFDDEREGDLYVANLERLLDAGHVPAEFQARDSARDVAGLIRNYLAAVSVSADDARLLSVLSDRLGDTRLLGIDYAWADDWLCELKRVRRLAPSTIRHYVGALARALDWAVSRDLVSDNPLRRLPTRYASYTDADAAQSPRVDQSRDRRLLPGEYDRLRAILSGEIPAGRQRRLAIGHGADLAALIDLALETGMRLREMYTLRIDQIDADRRTIFLDRTKNGQQRQVPLSTVALDVVQRQTVRATSDNLFPWWDGDTATLRKTTARISKQFARIATAAGCDDLRFHDLRHEATCRFYERTTLSDVEIARILGWRSLKMALRYANLRGSDLAERLW